VKAWLNLIGKALLPAALVFCAIKVSNSVHEGSTAVHESAAAVAKIPDAVHEGSTTAKQIVDNAPKTAHDSSQEFVKGAANGAVQVAATVPMLPVTVVGKGVEQLFPSDSDRENIERVVNPQRWHIF
jgi:hypothetical protein